MRIILVEDNRSLAKGIEDALRDHGHGVDHLDDGLAADNFLRTETADVAIIDINLPGLTGIEVTKRMRSRGDTTPVLMLTAMGKTSDRVVGLDAGADDYLVKPFEMAELMARLRALTRRRPQLMPEQELIGDLVYDRQQRVIMHKDKRIDLPRRELALFELLLDHKGKLMDRERIFSSLYGAGAEVEANAIELLVSRLRRKLDGTQVEIKTARGLGYMLNAGRA
ncbi:MAG: response regulator transcription factor [Rhizobium sp.]|nr:response regulator transcription factor [Rhizobium sp.]